MARPFRPILLAFLVAALEACGAARPVPEDARASVVSLQKIDCSTCGDDIVSELRRRPGVYDAAFDRRTAEVRVVASPTFDVITTVKSLAARRGWEAMLGAGQGAYLEAAEFPEGADVKTVAVDGADVPDLGPVLARGKVTVVDFTAIWCEPCRGVDRHMATFLAAHHEVAYRRLSIGDWDTPLAQHYLREVPQLPYVVVFDAAGVKVRAVVGLDLAALDAAIAEASSR